ncbi:Ribosomal RNA small subunit methyltransferase G [Aquimixticola soesokkakensis]|uniref:Ribosomal RNA small subunit methyltransferase G n=1 Tax=Aquimixticola soesokkakensis TaxID=1519096 RepID=A0A1Y5RAB6_9RHOB|nr:16S rRNA (guanine(527)-N(7))-methyltransferase RsmG [Aquimixticola soesokkakensis]SLN11665.1 Ribosomal RNA small subunit methyltransferase G [Aquimixticola soesokkakensis]
MNSLTTYPDVSRETCERLEIYAGLLRKWNPKINLVSATTLADLWTRHMEDSAQVLAAAPKTGDTWYDLGSGGGFPGLVCAILAQELRPTLQITCVESDLRKVSFLRTVIRETGLTSQVLAKRVEAIAPANADILSARALAPLGNLLAFASMHLKPSGTALFPKGVRYQSELDDAQSSWRFSVEEINSTTGQGSVILRIGDIERV